jgi:uncharacterized membrane protein YfcA
MIRDPIPEHPPAHAPERSPDARPAGSAATSMTEAALVGLAAGFLSGLFGVGGGILLVPALVIVLKLGQKLAHGTSLAAVLPIALSSLFGYTVEDKVDWPVAGLLAAGAIGGAVLGTHFLHRLPQRAVGWAFAVVLFATAVRLVVDNSDAGGRADLSILTAVALVVAGFLTGILAGLLGVGGGVVMVPAMVVGFGIPAAVAKGTSLAVIIPTSIMGTLRNRSNSNVDLRLAAVVGIAGVVSAYLASKISVGLSETTSNRLFAALLTAVAIRMVWQFVRSPDDD